MWKPIASAPDGRDLELAVIEKDAPLPLVFPCRRSPTGWLNALTNEPVPVHPTHWREWAEPETECPSRPNSR